MRLDSIAFGVLTRIYFNKIRNNLINILSIILVGISMYYFFLNSKNLTAVQLFLFILLIQYLSVNIIIIFINSNKLIVNKFLIRSFTILSNQTYSIYLFLFVFIYLISLNSFLFNFVLNFIIFV